MHRLRFASTGAILIAVAIAGRAGAEPTASTSAPPPTETKMSARDAGARYGQALGAIEICYGSKVTAATSTLGETYRGPEQEIFKAQAANVYQAWLGVKNCNKAVDPNQCKIIMDKSCAAAEAEIGPSGSALPGLVEFMKR